MTAVSEKWNIFISNHCVEDEELKLWTQPVCIIADHNIIVF